MIIRTLPTPLNLHVLFAPWCIPLSQPLPLTPVSHMHLFTLCVIIKATSPMSLIASLVASSNLFCILLYLSIAVLFAGNKSTTTTTNSRTCAMIVQFVMEWIVSLWFYQLNNFLQKSLSHIFVKLDLLWLVSCSWKYDINSRSVSLSDEKPSPGSGVALYQKYSYHSRLLKW